MRMTKKTTTILLLLGGLILLTKSSFLGGTPQRGEAVVSEPTSRSDEKISTIWPG